MTAKNFRGRFYREYWAEHDPKMSNQPDGGKRWRVNDKYMSTDERFGDRWETQANGLMLLSIPEVPRQLHSTELYLELWGGHPHTGQKSFQLNGKGSYNIPSNSTTEGHCTYTYPCVSFEIHDLVNGMNAFQFSCERGDSFWGHYIIDQAAVRCYCSDDDPRLADYLDKGFSPQIQVVPQEESLQLSISGLEAFAPEISHIEFQGHYHDFDDSGSGQEQSWHGYTQGREPVNSLGTATEPPFGLSWNTSMIPDQERPMKLRTIIHFKDDLKFQTDDLDNVELPSRTRSVQFIKCDDLPIPFWSRANQLKETTFQLDHAIQSIDCAQLMIKIWDGGEGTIDKPFTINGHAYAITSGHANHDVVFSASEIDPAHLREGTNTIKLLSDTEHHGIEVLFPGPCLKVRGKD